MKAARSHLSLYLALGYTLLVLYASLTPFTGWRHPGHDVFDFLRHPLPRYVQAFDTIINVLAYIPVGLFAALSLASRSRPLVVALCGTLVGAALSLSMEITQAYLPGRISSALDLLANVAGAMLGAGLAAQAHAAPAIRNRIESWRARLFLAGGRTDFGIALVGLWFFSQLDPSLPLLGIVFFSNGVQAQLAGIGADASYRLLGPASVCLTLVSLGMLLMLLMRSNRSALAGLAVLVWIAALLKLGAASMLLRSEAAFLWVSNEIVWAIMLGAALVALSALLPRRQLTACCALALIGTILLTFVRPDEVQSFRSLRFFRFSDLQLIRYTSLSGTVAAVWPYVALAYLLVLRFGDRRRV
jgi:VanZ family protein